MRNILVAAAILLWASAAWAVNVGPNSTQVTGKDADRDTITVANAAVAANGNPVYCNVGAPATTTDPQIAPNASSVFTTTEELHCISPLGSTVTITEALNVPTIFFFEANDCGSGSMVLATSEQTRNIKKIYFYKESHAGDVTVCPSLTCTEDTGVTLNARGDDLLVEGARLIPWSCTGTGHSISGYAR